MDTAKQNTKSLTIKKRKSSEDVYYPVPLDFNPIRFDKPPSNKEVVRRIIQGAIKASYRLKDPSDYDLKYGNAKGKAVATNEQMEMVMHLVESLQPADAIEATLASQFAITYIRGIGAAEDYNVPIDLFEFGHKVLEALQKYRSKGAQQISVQYNVNQGRVVNIKNVNPETSSEILDRENI